MCIKMGIILSIEVKINKSVEIMINSLQFKGNSLQFKGNYK